MLFFTLKDLPIIRLLHRAYQMDLFIDFLCQVYKHYTTVSPLKYVGSMDWHVVLQRCKLAIPTTARKSMG